jgi:predicted MFS family arabinose efflux permease
MTAFHKLWLGSLLATTANFTVYLLLASRILESTGSALLASLVFASQWVLPVLLVLRIEQAGRMLEPRRLMLGTALGFAALTAAVAIVMPTIATVLAVCAVFGSLEALVKNGRLVALKRFYRAEALQKSVSSLASAMYIGGALGGALFAIVPEEQSVAIVLGGAVAAHLATAALLATLPSAAAEVTPAAERGAYSVRAYAEALRIAAADARVFEALFCLVLVCGIFQGFHNVARTALPLLHLAAGEGAVGILQVVTGVAIIVGVLIYRAVFANTDGFGYIAGAVGYTGAALLIATTLPRSLETSFALYFAFILVFELLFVHFQTRLVVSVRSSDISLVSSFKYAIVNLAMLITAVAGGALVDAIGLMATAFVFSALFCVFYLAREAIRRSIEHPRSPDPT